MKIHDNISALQAYTNLIKTGRKIERASLRISSGYKINSVRDDAAGMAISNKLKDQINGMDMAARNALDGISLVQTADGALQEVSNMVLRIRELALQAANGTLEPEDREKAQVEIDQLFLEINDTAYKTEFNTIKILNGEAAAETFADGSAFMGLRLQIGANKGMELRMNIPDIPAGIAEISGTLSPGAPINVVTDGGAQTAITFCDEASAFISTVRAEIGAYQSRLEHTEANLGSINDSAKSALSRIIDADVALEMSLFIQNNIISQAGMAVLAQANQQPQQILALLQ